MQHLQHLKNLGVSNFAFNAYIFFILDFFLRFTSRVPVLGKLRLSALLFVIVLITAFLNKTKSNNRIGSEQTVNKLNMFLLFLIISLPLVEYPGSAIKNNLSDFLKAIAFFYFTIVVCDTPKRFKILVSVFVGCQIFRVLEPLIIYMTTGYLGSATYIGGGEFAGRLSGSDHDVINSNELGFVIATIVPYLYYLMFLGDNKKLKIISIIVAPMLLYALILTMSRGAMLALVVVFYFIFKESNKKFILMIAGAIVVVAMWTNLTPLQKERYLSLVSSDSQFSGSSEGRLEGMSKEFELGFTRPIVGHGIGTTAEAKFHNYGKLQASHIFWAELIIETGVIGFLLFIRFLLTLKNKINATKVGESLNPQHDLYMKCFLAIFWMFCAYSTNYWGVSQYYWYFFAGLIVAYSSIFTQAKNEEK